MNADMVDFASAASAQIPLVCVLGPTASGKSGLALALAAACNGEIVSADALAVYREMDIGTAKPSAEELALVPHHCVNVFDPSESCDAQSWLDLAEAAVVDIHSRGKLPILAGGTPLYFKLLVEGISAGPPKDTKIRSNLEQRYREEGADKLFAELKDIDPEYAANRHPNDAKRIIRALEVYQISGKPYSSFHTTDGTRRACWRTLLLGLRWDKEQLHSRINLRAKEMFNAGLLDEVRSLQDRLSKQARDGVGYKEVIGHFKGEYDLAHALYLVRRHTRLLAKHQKTWYRRFHDIQWLEGAAPDLNEQALTRVRHFLAAP